MRREVGRETMSGNGSQIDSNVMSEHAGKSLRSLGIPSGNVQDFVSDLSLFLSNRVSKFMHSPVVFKEQESRTQITKPAKDGDARPNILVRAAGPGLIMGRIDLVDWATQTHERFDTPNGVNILKNSLLSLINGSMGQRGLLMRQIQAHNIGIRYVNMVIEFSVWLPSTDKKDTDSCYADCIKDSMNRLSLKEVQQYFPLFLFGSNGKDTEVSMVSLPMAAPAAVPNDTETADITSPKDACEMLFCTTKQKKRKGVPYCGTCRKFMEETVKWYCDTHRIHPAKEKDKFVPAVRNERYGCKHPKVGTCDCKSCHSLRRFDELYPNCVAKLDEFKRRTFMFNDADAEHETEKLVLTKRGKQEQLELEKANKLASSKKFVIPGIAIPTWNPSQNTITATPPRKSPNPFENLPLSSSALPSPKLLNNGKVKEEDAFGNWTGEDRNNSNTQRFNNKRKLTLPQPPGSQNGYKTRRKASITGAVEIPKMQEDLISILPDYILPSPRRHSNANNANNNNNNNTNNSNTNNHNDNNHNHDDNHNGNNNGNGNANTTTTNNNNNNNSSNFISDVLASPGLDLDGADNLYKAMWDEDPISFTLMETMAQTSLMNTWSCVLCATWNHRGRQFCSTCGSTRTKL